MEITGNHRSAASLLCFLTGVPVSSGYPDARRKAARCRTGLSERKSWDGSQMSGFSSVTVTDLRGRVRVNDECSIHLCAPA